MKFVFIHPHLEFGGAERQSILMANEMQRRGHHATIILFRANGGLLERVAPGVDVIDLGLESHVLLLEVARRLRHALSKLPPSIVIVKLWSAILATSLIDGSLPQHTIIYNEDLDPKTHAKFIRLGHLKQFAIRHVFRKRPYVTANTFAVRDAMVSKYGLQTAPQVISPCISMREIDAFNGEVESAAGYRFLCEAPVATLKLVSVGSLVHLKGLEVTKSAVANADLRVRWLIIGRGPLESDIRTWSGANFEVCVVPGHLRPFDFVRAADLLVHSAFSEALGVVILEALGVGTPVIASDTLGGIEIQSRLGLEPTMLSLYPVGDSGALSKLLASHAPDGHSIPRELFQEYVEPYTIDVVFDDFLSYVQRIGRQSE